MARFIRKNLPTVHQSLWLESDEGTFQVKLDDNLFDDSDKAVINTRWNERPGGIEVETNLILGAKEHGTLKLGFNSSYENGPITVEVVVNYREYLKQIPPNYTPHMGENQLSEGDIEKLSNESTKTPN